MGSIESLLREKRLPSRERWYPRDVNELKQAILIDRSVDNSAALVNNIAYSLQYLEFLEKEFQELQVSSVLSAMLVKTYVITSMSILEGIFTNIVKSHGWWKQSDLESLGETQANEKDFSGNRYVIKTELLKKVTPFPQKMTLDELIRVLDNHHDALGVDHLVYPALRRLKDLRNRIHLQKNEYNTDHDYNAFNFDVKKEMLTSPVVSDSPDSFAFLQKNTRPTYTAFG